MTQIYIKKTYTNIGHRQSMRCQQQTVMLLLFWVQLNKNCPLTGDVNHKNKCCWRTWHCCVVMTTSQLQISFSITMLKQMKKPEGLSKSRTFTQAASAPIPTNKDRSSLFFRTDSLQYSKRESFSNPRGWRKPWNQSLGMMFRGRNH